MGRFAHLAEQMGDIEGMAWKEVWHFADECSQIIRAMPQHRRRHATIALIDEKLEAQNGICPFCERAIDRTTVGAFQLDHIIPFARGGGPETDNIQIVHPECNRKKGNSVDVRDLVPYLERKAEEISDWSII